MLAYALNPDYSFKCSFKIRIINRNGKNKNGHPSRNGHFEYMNNDCLLSFCTIETLIEEQQLVFDRIVPVLPVM
jgi:hypothetical protein